MTAQNSSLHRKTLSVLTTTPPFKNSRILSEVAVSELFPTYNNNRDRYDIVLLDYKCIIECMGVQHSKLQTFGEDAGKALLEFQSLQTRDARKKEVALLHGWTYIAIPYTDEKLINSIYLLNIYNLNTVDSTVVFTEEEEPEHIRAYREKQRELGRAARKERYEYLKQLKKGSKDEN